MTVRRPFQKLIGCSGHRLRRRVLDFKLSRRQRLISAARKCAPSVAPRRTLLKRRIRRLTPTLAGGTVQDRVFAALGALAGVGLATLCCWLALGGPPELAIVAPIGASAVLVFAVPASPLAQPWSVVGGNAVSALVGLAVGQALGDPFLAAGIATALAIGAMSLARCLHPPGGAIALGSAIAGYQGGVRAFEHATPIVLTSVTLVALGWAFHRFSKHSYPHAPVAAPVNTHKTRDTPSQLRVGFSKGDIDAALVDLNEPFDIDRDDLDGLLRQVELRALDRVHGGISCADVMSRDVIRVGDWEEPGTAARLLLDHGVRSLPVQDRADEVIGVVGLRDLISPAKTIGEVMRPPTTAASDDPAVSLFSVLTDGTTHSVSILDENRRLLGVVTQTDLLMAMARSMALTR